MTFSLTVPVFSHLSPKILSVDSVFLSGWLGGAETCAVSSWVKGLTAETDPGLAEGMRLWPSTAWSFLLLCNVKESSSVICVSVVAKASCL